MASDPRKRTRVTLMDVAQHAGVSRATASLVIRNSPLVGADTRARVETSIEALGYVYNMGAARMRAERSLTIGVVIPNLTNPFFAELLGGIETVIGAAGMVVMLVNSGDDVGRQDMLLTRMRQHGVDGVILCPAADTDFGLVRRVLSWELPLVQVLRRVSDRFDYAGADYASGMQQAVDHLAELGHENIAFAVHGPIHSAYDERVSGFRRATLARGMKPDNIRRVAHQISAIAEGAEAFMKEAGQPTAIICFNDIVAMGLSAGLHDLGLRVGKDISLIGFDDVSDAEAMRPRLTSVATFPERLGEDAARLLLDRLGEPDRSLQVVVRDTKLQIRGSCSANRFSVSKDVGQG